jgi:hypothetical protein
VCAGHSQQRCDDLYWAAQDSKEFFFSLYFLKKKNKNISIGSVCVGRTENKKKQSNTQVGPTRIYIYRRCQVGLHCYIYYIGSGGYFSRLSALDIHKEHWETLLPGFRGGGSPDRHCPSLPT